jgi:hypothetical protein
MTDERRPVGIRVGLMPQIAPRLALYAEGKIKMAQKVSCDWAGAHHLPGNTLVVSGRWKTAMRLVSVDQLQVAIVLTICAFSLLIIVKHLFARKRSLISAADHWLWLWFGGGTLLLLLEGIQVAVE